MKHFNLKNVNLKVPIQNEKKIFAQTLHKKIWFSF